MESRINPMFYKSEPTLPPNTTVEWNDAQREDEEAQRHGLPPSKSIDRPQCHQQSYATTSVNLPNVYQV